MAVLNTQALTWADLIAKQGPDRQITLPAEVLNQHNSVMQDAAFVSANKGLEHEVLVRAGLPTVAWMKVAGFVSPTKSKTVAQKFTTGFCRSLSQVPQDILDLAGDEAAVRISEANPHLEAMSQEFEFMFFNGNTKTNPMGFDGLAAYYNSLPVGTNNASNQVISAGGAGSDNASIWIVRHGEQYTSCITPEHIPMGIQRDDKGSQRESDGAGGVRYVQEELFTLHGGVAIKDYRANSRVANIDVSDAMAGTVDLNSLLVSAWHKARFPKHNTEVKNAAFLGARACIYMNGTLFEAMDRLSRNSTRYPALQLGVKEIQGEEVTTWRGLPIRVTDGLTNSEATLV